MTSPTLASRTAAPDAVAAAAVDLAREAAVDVAEPGTVGEYLGVVVEGVRLVTHRFASTAKGYRGWVWSVTVARAPRAKVATVCEAVLLPAEDAILAPQWLPWADRVAPGDLGVSDVLGFRADDPFLEQGYEATDDEEADRLAIWELGLGRKRVLSPVGRADAARRWYEGSHGPTADVAVHASAACSTCGFFLALAGEMRQVFGVCANEWSPSDGTVVSVDHGCGAHSETDVDPQVPDVPGGLIDDDEFDAMDLRQADAAIDGADVVEAVADVGAVADLEAVTDADAQADVEAAAEALSDSDPDLEAQPLAELDAVVVVPEAEVELEATVVVEATEAEVIPGLDAVEDPVAEPEVEAPVDETPVLKEPVDRGELEVDAPGVDAVEAGQAVVLTEGTPFPEAGSTGVDEEIAAPEGS